MWAAVVLFAAQGTLASNGDIRGQWVNERSSAIVRIADCPSGLCGTIVWSTPLAQRDAGRGGNSALNGTDVMFGFVAASERMWRGRLFVPDLNRTVTATIELQDNGMLKVKGCELGGLLCKSQRWRQWGTERGR